ncbi:MoxR family ATPase [Nocardia sp. NRRL S-836]|uniref:AAA family ATPase n=1 Tax=Nocardia sp. NRRL S-836 TaxID=1519492 RepID=UPI0006B02C69|nr:MoxR family ATPase [Nocardia sp. NRRL S-836]KOV81760.1 ATPase [Nocardia sp. NRRL S-836]
MEWAPYYRGDGSDYEVDLPDPPPWRSFSTAERQVNDTFQPPPGLVDAVNAAICLCRPLLITGPPGSGKSSVADSIASELKLGSVLRWHITSRSTLTDALYRYDALGRLDAHKRGVEAGLGPFIELGPLGTALLPSQRPRVLLIDEIDKSDIDLPSDLLNVLERGEYNIPELTRQRQRDVRVRRWKATVTAKVHKGHVRCTKFPLIVMTSNGERDFPAPFLRRCIRFTMPKPDADQLTRIVTAHLGPDDTKAAEEMLQKFAEDIENHKPLATDQLLNAIFLATRAPDMTGDHRKRLTELLLKVLT